MRMTRADSGQPDAEGLRGLPVEIDDGPDGLLALVAHHGRDLREVLSLLLNAAQDTRP